jgi:hypothetical protein
MRCERADRQNLRIGAFSPGSISNFEGRSGAWLFPDGPGIEHASRKIGTATSVARGDRIKDELFRLFTEGRQ